LKEKLSIESYCGKVLENQLHRQESDTLVLLLPGMNYTTNSPLLYYAFGLFEELGYDILPITYAFQYYHLPFDTNDLLNVYEDTHAILRAALQKGHYKRIMLVGKSMGTVIQAKLIADLSDYDLLNIWMTPIPYAKDMIKSNHSLVIVGSEDSYFLETDVKEIEAYKHVTLYCAMGANHSLNTKSVRVSLDYLVKSMKAIGDFLELHERKSLV